MNIEVKILETSLLENDCNNFVANESCGGIVTFVGKVRNDTNGKKVIKLEYESFEKMALSEMAKIANKALELFELKKIGKKKSRQTSE